MGVILDPGHRLLFISISEYVVQENFLNNMTDQNSTVNNLIRPDELIAELSVGRATYYDDLKHLGIKAAKDGDGKAHLTFEQAEQVRALRSYVSKYGKRQGFNYEEFVNENNSSNSESSIVKAEEQSIQTSNSSATNITIAEEEIFITEQEPTNNVDLNQVFSNAEKLAAKKFAIADLLTVELAENMTYEDLSPELRQKIDIANEAATGKKFQVKNIAQNLLKQRRMQRVA